MTMIDTEALSRRIEAREQAEAKARQLMAKRAALPETWENRDARATLLVRINAALSVFNTFDEAT